MTNLQLPRRRYAMSWRIEKGTVPVRSPGSIFRPQADVTAELQTDISGGVKDIVNSQTPSANGDGYTFYRERAENPQRVCTYDPSSDAYVSSGPGPIKEIVLVCTCIFEIDVGFRGGRTKPIVSLS